MGDIEGDENFSDWEENEDENYCIVDLFSTETFPSIKEFLLSTERGGFDLLEVIRKFGCDEIAIIMLINFIRSEVKAAENISEAFKNTLKAKALAGEFLREEAYMKPVLDSDSVLYLLGEYVVNNALSSSERTDNDWETDTSFVHLFEKVQAVESLSAAEISQIRSEIGDMSEADAGILSENDLYTGNYYFDGYSHIGIHETMLRDHARTTAYGEAMMRNSEYIRGKVVLDIGCGTGILCLFAARAGARKVVGVDCSAIALKAREIVRRNGFQDVITIVRGQLEEVELPLEAGEVDIIVSEWMGYGLYYENMLPAVLHARDKYLKVGESRSLNRQHLEEKPSSPASSSPSPGAMMPSHAFLFLEAGSTSSVEVSRDSYDGDRVGWWKDVYGFDMSDMVGLFTSEAQVDLCAPECIVSSRARVHDLEILRASDADLDFTVPFELRISRNCLLRSFVISFDVVFSSLLSNAAEVVVTLPTGVQHTPTHWKQTLLWLNPDNVCSVAEGDVVSGTIRYLRMESNIRDYEIRVTWNVSSCQAERSQLFVLAS